MWYGLIIDGVLADVGFFNRVPGPFDFRVSVLGTHIRVAEVSVVISKVFPPMA